jgi:hypothetical protein
VTPPPNYTRTSRLAFQQQEDLPERLFIDLREPNPLLSASQECEQSKEPRIAEPKIDKPKMLDDTE